MKFENEILPPPKKHQTESDQVSTNLQKIQRTEEYTK